MTIDNRIDHVDHFHEQQAEYVARVRALENAPAAGETPESVLAGKVARLLHGTIAEGKAAAAEELAQICLAQPPLTAIVTAAAVAEIGRLTARTRALEAQVAALEARPFAIKYCGVYSSLLTYEKGEIVTHSGSMWIAKDRTTQRPDEFGDGLRHWQLACKRGRDGKDGRDLG